MNEEIWKDIPKYEGRYQVSNLGRVKSFRNGKQKILRLFKTPRYLAVSFYPSGRRVTKKVHRLVMLAFVGPSNLQVNHINGIKTDNRLENLEYCTSIENNRHALDVGLNNITGENNGQSKLSCVEAKQIKYGYKGWPLIKVSKLHRISESQIRTIRAGKQWKHI
jgi:hypothetical protein